jgi:hypothetical protein
MCIPHSALAQAVVAFPIVWTNLHARQATTALPPSFTSFQAWSFEDAQPSLCRLVAIMRSYGTVRSSAYLPPGLDGSKRITFREACDVVVFMDTLYKAGRGGPGEV